MIHLLKCEFRKFRNTYINSLSLLGMLSPVVLVTVMFLMRKTEWIKSGAFTFDNFNSQMGIFFVFLVGPIITSFIAVFTVFYEYQQKTLKNLLMYPCSRTLVILSKVIYVSLYVLLQYVTVALAGIACGLLLGLKFSPADALLSSRLIILAGGITILLVPAMMAVTLVSKSFIPAMVITVCGTISNVLTLNWDKSYLSPWAIPSDVMLIAKGDLHMNMGYPLASFGIYFTLFLILITVYFRRADQNI